MNLKRLQVPYTRLTILLRVAPKAASVCVVLVGCLVLVGWALNIPLLKSLSPTLVTMKANTAITPSGNCEAIAFVLCGIALWLVPRSRSHRRRGRFSQGLAILVMLIGLLTLSEYLLNWDAGIDQRLFQEPAGAIGTPSPGRMAPSTAFNFWLTGMALWLLGWRRGYWLAQVLALIATLIAWQALIGYAYSVEALNGVQSYTQMAVHTILTFLVLCGGILSARPDRGVMELITNDRISGFIARRLLLAAIITPLGLGWLVVQGIRANWYSSAFGLSFLAGASTVTFVLMIWRTVETLDQRDRDHRQAQVALKEMDKRFRHLVESNILGVAFSGFDGELIYANDAFLNLVGYTREELKLEQLHWDDITPPEYAHLDQRAAEELRVQGTCTPFEKEFIRKDGQRIPVLLGATLLQEPYDQQQEMACFILDRTDAKRLEAVRQQTERALRSANERFEMAAAAIRGVIYDWDLDSDRVERTQGLVDVIGFLPHEVEPTRDWWRERIHPDDLVRLAQAYNQTLSNADSFTFEYRVLHRDGHYRQVWDRALLLRNDQGQIVRVVGCNLDVTERYQAEAALRESEERFRLMADTAPVMIWMSGIDKQGVYFNRGWLEFTGRTLEQELGDGWLETIHPDDLSQLEVCAKAFVARRPFTVEYRMRRFDGEYRWIFDTGTPRYTPDGSFSGYIGSCIDIHDRRQAETAQHYLAEVSKTLFSSLNDQTTLTNLVNLTIPYLADVCTLLMVEEDGSLRPIATAYADRENVRWLEELRQRYPFSPNDLYGVAQVLRTGQPELYPMLPKSLLQQSARNSEHLEILQQSGLRSALIVPLEARSKILGVMCFFLVNSQRHYNAADLALAEELARRAALAVDNARLYQTAQHDRAKAEAANRSKDEFLAMLSHELRTPLNAMQGWTHLLRTRKLDTATMDRALETIDRNTRSLSTLIEDLLDVSRIITGKLKLNRCPVDLHAIVEAAVESIQLSAAAKKIHLRVVVDQSVEQWGPLVVFGDSNRLQQIIWNLLSNAVKFTPQEGQVEVLLRVNSSSESSTGVQIRVKDTGVGIAPTFLPHVFDRFRQADSSTTRTYGGLGLGLAIVRYLVEMHEGGVAVESLGEGKGATFIVNLPLLQVKSEQVRNEEVKALPLTSDASPLTGLRILVVDDEDDAQHLLRIVLTQSGAADVVACSSAAEAMRLLIDSHPCPDILISDIGMPDEDGCTFIRRIRSLDTAVSRIPAIALTAYARAEDRENSLQAGFQQHLTKPVNPTELVNAIVKLMRSGHSRSDC